MFLDLPEKLLGLFVNRKDVYAEQQPCGRYLKVQKPVTREVVRNHLAHEFTMGCYQLNKENKVKWLCWDLDPEKLDNPSAAANKLVRECIMKPGPKKPRFWRKSLLLEASRHPDPSYHIWVFFWPLPIPAKAARWLGLKILEHANINPKKVEVFPKQTRLTKHRPYGNLVKAPLGLHRVAKKPSCFLDLETLQPLPDSNILNVEGVSFYQSDIQRICSFNDKKHVQSRLKLPQDYEALEDREEEKIVEFLLKYWKPGLRNRLEMAFLGWCLKKGVGFKSARRIVDQVTSRTDDEERHQRLQLVEYHYQDRRQLGGELLAVSGLRRIVEEILQ